MIIIARIRDLLGYQFLKFHYKLIEPLEEALRPVGITSKNFHVMELIKENPGVSQIGLSEIMQKGKPVIGQVIDKLEEKHLVKREPVENDRRTYALSLTEEGNRIVSEYQQVVLGSEHTFLACLNAEDQANLRRILSQLMQNGIVKFSLVTELT